MELPNNERLSANKLSDEIGLSVVDLLSKSKNKYSANAQSLATTHRDNGIDDVAKRYARHALTTLQDTQVHVAEMFEAQDGVSENDITDAMLYRSDELFQEVRIPEPSDNVDMAVLNRVHYIFGNLGRVTVYNIILDGDAVIDQYRITHLPQETHYHNKTISKADEFEQFIASVYGPKVGYYVRTMLRGNQNHSEINEIIAMLKRDMDVDFNDPFLCGVRQNAQEAYDIKQLVDPEKETIATSAALARVRDILASANNTN